MSTTIGILVFDGVEELDFVGPWEVFATAAKITDQGSIVTIAETPGRVHCSKGLRVVPDHTFTDAPDLDVLLVPGGLGTRREVKNQETLEWIGRMAGRCRWVTSVCTGVLLLHGARVVQGRRVATHRDFVENLRELGGVTVIENARYVQDGKLVTAAGVSAGIDMALWLVGQIWGMDTALEVQDRIEYFPEPPYQERRKEASL